MSQYLSTIDALSSQIRQLQNVHLSSIASAHVEKETGTENELSQKLLKLEAEVNSLTNVVHMMKDTLSNERNILESGLQLRMDAHINKVIKERVETSLVTLKDAITRLPQHSELLSLEERMQQYVNDEICKSVSSNMAMDDSSYTGENTIDDIQIKRRAVKKKLHLAST
jgi:uncharacterized protein (DUF342 family)